MSMALGLRRTPPTIQVNVSTCIPGEQLDSASRYLVHMLRWALRRLNKTGYASLEKWSDRVQQDVRIKPLYHELSTAKRSTPPPAWMLGATSPRTARLRHP